MDNGKPLTVQKAEKVILDLEKEIEQYRNPERLKKREIVRAQELGDFMWTVIAKSKLSFPGDWLPKLRQRKKGWVFEEDALVDDGWDVVHEKNGNVTFKRKAEKSS